VVKSNCEIGIPNRIGRMKEAVHYHLSIPILMVAASNLKIAKPCLEQARDDQSTSWN